MLENTLVKLRLRAMQAIPRMYRSALFLRGPVQSNHSLGWDRSDTSRGSRSHRSMCNQLITHLNADLLFYLYIL